MPVHQIDFRGLKSVDIDVLLRIGYNAFSKKAGDRINLRVYFETTVFSRYFEEGREYHPDTKQLFEMTSSGNVIAFTSVAVLQEIDKASEPERENDDGIAHEL